MASSEICQLREEIISKCLPTGHWRCFQTDIVRLNININLRPSRFIHRIWIWPMSLRGIMFSITVPQLQRRNCSLASPCSQSFSCWYFSIVSAKISSLLPSPSTSCSVTIAQIIKLFWSGMFQQHLFTEGTHHSLLLEKHSTCWGYWKADTDTQS